MKKYLLTVLLLILLPGLLSSCKKKETVTFPQTLYVTGIAKKSEIRMFTHHAEIKDTAVINHYVAGSKFFNLQNDPFDPSDHLTFESEDTVVFPWTSTKFSVTRTDDLFLFYSKIPCVYIDMTTRLDILVDTLLKYKDRKIPVPSGTNLCNYITREVIVAHGNFQELELSSLSLKISLPGGYFSEKLLNELYEGAMYGYGSYDTVAVQSFSIHLRPG